MMFEHPSQYIFPTFLGERVMIDYPLPRNMVSPNKDTTVQIRIP